MQSLGQTKDNMERELEKELRHKTEELNQIKEVLAIYLDKVYYDIDDITPEDLERKLREHESEKFHNTPDYETMLNAAFWIMEIEQLCRDLGWTEFAEYNKLHNIKLFIKSLARENFRLKQMSGKQTDGDSRTNNWGSSDTSTNE